MAKNSIPSLAILRTNNVSLFNCILGWLFFENQKQIEKKRRKREKKITNLDIYKIQQQQ